jgi:hypothetical protein
MGNEVLDLLNDEECVKILCCADDAGTPHPVVKDSLRSEGGNILYLEFIESSRTNRYMTKALWFDRTVTVLIVTSDKRSFSVTARPVRALVCGKEFQAFYREAKQKYGGLDLSTVWILKPEEITEQTLRKRVDEETTKRPYFVHLDRLKKEQEGKND